MKPQDDRELELLTMQNLMSTESGRHFAYRILEQCGLMSDTFDEDPCIHARNSGKRAVGLWLQSELIESSLDNYLIMIKEHSENG